LKTEKFAFLKQKMIKEKR